MNKNNIKEGKKMNNITEIQGIKTFCPNFNGFYNSIYDYDYDNVKYNINEIREEKNLLPIDDFEIDFKKYAKDVSEKYCEVMQNVLKDYVNSIVFENVHSPKEYNYYNDSINCTIDIKYDVIKEYIYNNIDAFNKYLKNNFTSCDGFISFYGNTFESWKDDTKDFIEYGKEIGYILEFIYNNIFDVDDNLNIYEIVMNHIDTLEYIENQ
jgi:hypothetical protein